MTKPLNRLIPFALAAFALLGGFALPAHAQATRTWISGVGDDANPCSRTAPCKTFAGAISKTAAGGEIDVLDPGGFGGVTITKGITLRAEGSIGSILVGGTNGVTIAAGATDVVNIINIEFFGERESPSAAGLDGIKITSAGQVNIIHCDIRAFSVNGIEFALNASTPTNVMIRDTIVQDNAGGGIFAAQAGTGQLKVVVDNDVITGPGSTTSAIGIQVTGATTSLTLNNSTVGFNGTDLSIVSGNLFSFGNNRVVYSPTPGASNQTILSTK